MTAKFNFVKLRFINICITILPSIVANEIEVCTATNPHNYHDYHDYIATTSTVPPHKEEVCIPAVIIVCVPAVVLSDFKT